MRPFLAASDFSLDDLLDNAIDLFVVVPLDQVGEQAGYLRLITNLVLAAAIRQDGRRVAHERILFVLDELTRLGYMDKIVDVATIAAGAGIEALFVAQDRGSIEKVYGRDITDTLLASCATVRVFNPAFPRCLRLALTVGVNSTKIIRTIRAMTGASNGSDVG